jgi:hypothetical protein
VVDMEAEVAVGAGEAVGVMEAAVVTGGSAAFISGQGPKVDGSPHRASISRESLRLFGEKSE